MALWARLMVNAEQIGVVEIQRREFLDLTAQAAIQDEISTYDVTVDGQACGTVRHRYGDGGWRLLALAADAVAARNAEPAGPSR